MTTLPSEVNRCRPQVPAKRCNNCKRWADHPEQLIGSISRVVNTQGIKDPACVYVPISLLEAA